MIIEVFEEKIEWKNDKLKKEEEWELKRHWL